MLKNSFKIIAIILTIILCLFTPFSFADEENSTQLISEQEPSKSENPESSDAEETPAQATDDNSFKESDIYLVGDNITIDYIVDGNLFICANNVTISSQIGGDAFICAKNITITEQSYIFSNLFAISNSLNIEGVVYDIYSCANNITISGYVYRDIKTTSNTLNIFGTIGRNAFVSANNIKFVKYDENSSTEENTEQKNILAQGNITGDLNYSSKTELPTLENNVNGNVKYSSTTSNLKNTIMDYVISLLTSLALVLIIWLVCIFIVSITIRNILCKKFNITKKTLSFVILMIVTAILLGLSFVPYLGTILKLTYMIWGLGILIKNLLPHKKEKVENN